MANYDSLDPMRAAIAQAKPITFAAVKQARDDQLLDWLEEIAGEIRLYVDRQGVWPQHLHKSRVRVRMQLRKRLERRGAREGS